MKVKYIFSILEAMLMCSITGIAQEQRMVINYHNSRIQYNVEDVTEVAFYQQLSAPTAVHCTVSGDAIKVEWLAVKGATGYTVARSTDGISFSEIGKCEANSYEDATPTVGYNYYRITATGDAESSEPSNASNPVYFVPSDITATGLYMGIIGFNRTTNVREIQILSPNTINGFTTFVNSLTSDKGTLLYQSVDDAIEMLANKSLPSDLTSISIVTFTDGLDQGSVMKSSEHSTNSDFLENIKTRLNNTKINDMNIEAYAVGLRGTDVKDVNAFRKNLQYLATSEANAAEITDLSQLNAKFAEIASRLSETVERQTISLKIAANPGTRMRFTFDQIADGSDASASRLYIEATYYRRIDENQQVHHWLEEISYHGLSSSAGTAIEGAMAETQDGIVFTFADVMVDDGTKLSLDNYKRWRYITSLSYWNQDSEGGEALAPVSETTYKSGAVILVLDCSTSLGTQFSTVKSQAIEFIKMLAANTVVSDEEQWQAIGMGKYVDGFMPSFLGTVPEVDEVIVQKSTTASGLYRLIRPWKRYGSDENFVINAATASNVNAEQPTGVEIVAGKGPVTLSFVPSKVKLANGIFTFDDWCYRYTTTGSWIIPGVLTYGSQLLLPDAEYQPLTMTVNSDKAAFTLTSGQQNHLYRISWGDGSKGTVFSGSDPITHSYDKSGEYTINIYGPDVTALSAPNTGVTAISFPNISSLTSLDVSGNALTALNLSGASSLTDLNCSDNKLQTILGLEELTNLSHLNASSNQLTDLNLSYLSQLRFADISNNELSVHYFPENSQIEYLDISNNKYLSFSLLDMPKLEIFKCSGNPGDSGIFSVEYYQGVISVPQGFDGSSWMYNGAIVTPQYGINGSYVTMQSLASEVTLTLSSEAGTVRSIVNWGDGEQEAKEISSEVKLTHTYKTDAEHSIVISGNITSLECYNNELTTINLNHNSRLEHLDCSYNKLDLLDLTSLKSLIWLCASNNNLTSLDLSNNLSLAYLYISNNKISSLELNVLPNLGVMVAENNLLTEIDLEANSNIYSIYVEGNPGKEDKLTDASINSFRIYTPFQVSELSNIEHEDQAWLHAGRTVIPIFGPRATSVSIDNKLVNIPIGGNATLKAEVFPATTYPNLVTWSSGNSTIATVDKNGKVVAIKPGKTIINASSEDSKITDYCTVIVYTPVSNVIFNNSTVKMKVGERRMNQPTITPENADFKQLSWKSGDSNIVTVSEDGTLTAISAGKTSIVASTTDGSNISRSFDVYVSDAYSGFINGYQYVDLGLPSGTKWAIDDLNSEFAWGEAKTKSSFTVSNSSTTNVRVDDYSGNPSYDPARAIMGATWRTPTKAEMEELVTKCTWVYEWKVGEKYGAYGTGGFTVTGPNGRSIFIATSSGSSIVYFWTSTPVSDNLNLAYCLQAGGRNNIHAIDTSYRYFGLRVLPVSN